MSLSESVKSLSQRLSIKRPRTLSLPAARQIWGIVKTKLGGKAHLTLSKFSVHRSRTSQDSGSWGDSDTSTGWDSWTSQASHSSTSSTETVAEWDPDQILPSIEPIKPLPTISFSAPLAPAEELLIGSITIDPQSHPFLTSFLCQPRYTDIPFGIAHRLLGYIMHLLEEAAFDFVTAHTPNNKSIYYGGNRFKWAYSADDVEIQRWVRHISKSTALQGHLAEGSLALCNSLEHLRDSATHSWVYDSWQFRAAVAFLATLKDEKRLTSLEQVLKTVYFRTQAPGECTITDEENVNADLALGLIRTEPVTLHQLLCRVQELLERACFNFWVKHNPQRLTELEWHFPDGYDRSCVPPGVTAVGWDCPERAELQRWRTIETPGLYWKFEPFPARGRVYNPDAVDDDFIEELLLSAALLRNLVGHRDHRPPKSTMEVVFEDVHALASELGDHKAAAEIDELRQSPLLFWIYDEQEEATKKVWEGRDERDDEARQKWAHSLVLEDILLLHN